MVPPRNRTLMYSKHMLYSSLYMCVCVYVCIYIHIYIHIYIYAVYIYIYYICCAVLNGSVVSNPANPWIVENQSRILELVDMSSFRGSSQPRDQTQVTHIAGGFLLSKPPWKPKNIGVGSLSLLQ